MTKIWQYCQKIFNGNNVFFIAGRWAFFWLVSLMFGTTLCCLFMTIFVLISALPKANGYNYLGTMANVLNSSIGRRTYLHCMMSIAYWYLVCF